MIGAIRTWDVLRHPIVTIRCFGFKTYVRSLLAGPKQTFLSLLSDFSFFGSCDSQAADIVKQCIDLELRARQLYLNLAATTANNWPLSQFLTELAEHEQEHADLLQLCMAASNNVGWRHKDLPKWRSSLVRLNQEMGEIEAIASVIRDPEAAMGLVIELESSEVNQVFLDLIASSNSEFVKKLRPFQYAVEMHKSHITAGIAALTPNLRVQRLLDELPLSPATPQDTNGGVASDGDDRCAELVMSGQAEP
jgi:rubrerythrin